jgi:hypothetical protein
MGKGRDGSQETDPFTIAEHSQQPEALVAFFFLVQLLCQWFCKEGMSSL